MPQESSVSDRVNQFLASTDAPEFTARNIADAIGVKAVNVVSAALSKLKSDKKITYRVIPHELWGRPIHMYINPRHAGVQAPIVTPPRPVRLGKRELVNPGCTALVDGWIEKQLIGREESGEDGGKFTSTDIAEATGININRVSALLNALRYKRRIRIVEKRGCQNVYFTTKKLFSKERRRKVPVVVLAPRPEAAPSVKGYTSSRTRLVDQLLETAIQVEKSGPTREVCLNLIQTLADALKG